MNPQPKHKPLRLTGPAKRDLQAQVRNRDNYICQVCGIFTLGPPHHEPPVSQGGEDKAECMITLCMSCHDIRHNRKGSREMRDRIVKRLAEINGT